MPQKKLQPGSNRRKLWDKLSTTTPLSVQEIKQKVSRAKQEIPNINSTMYQLWGSGWVTISTVAGVKCYLQSTPDNTVKKQPASPATIQGRPPTNSGQNIRIKIWDFLKSNIGQGFTRSQVTKAVGLSPKHSAPSTYLTLFVKAKYVKVKGVHHSRTFTAQASMLDCVVAPTAGQIENPTKRKSNVPMHAHNMDTTSPEGVAYPPQPAEGYAIPAPALNAAPLNVGEMVNQILAVNQQNEVYRQAFSAILNIMEQIKVVESE